MKGGVEGEQSEAGSKKKRVTINEKKNITEAKAPDTNHKDVTS